MNLGAISVIGAFVGVLAVIAPLFFWMGKLKQQQDDHEKRLNDQGRAIGVLEKDSGDMKILFARIDENLKQIKEALKIKE